MNLFDLSEKYKLAALVFVVWACWIVTTVVLAVFDDVGKLTGGDAVMGLTAVLGLPTIAAGILRWRRDGSKRDGEH